MRAERIWEARRCDEAHADVVARELGVSPVTARLLCIRGLGDLDGARRFPIVVRLPEAMRQAPEAIGALVVTAPGGERVPLDRLARMIQQARRTGA